VPALVNKPNKRSQKASSLVHYIYQFDSEMIFDSAKKSKRQRKNLKAIITLTRIR